MRFPLPGVRASIAAIAAVIGLIGWLQYIWFRQAASAEMEDTYRSLNATVMQTLSREYQRYAPLLADLRAMAFNTSVSENQARDELERALGRYGPSGPEPGLVASVLLISASDPYSAYCLAPGGSWGRSPQGLDSTVSELARSELADGLAHGDGSSGWRIAFSSDGGDRPRQFVIAKAGTGLIAFVELDTAAFFEQYVKPSVSETLPGAMIEWETFEARSEERGEAPPRGFNPIKALLGIESKRRRTFDIYVPAAFDAYMFRPYPRGDAQQPRKFIDELQLLGPRPGEASAAAPPAQPQFQRRPTMRMVSAHVEFSAASAFGSTERRLSLMWLLGETLLVLLGAAFSLAVVQRERSEVMRRRQREFVASVTHELRTPVTAIRSASDNMRRGLVGSDRLAAYGEIIHSQSLRLSSMIEEVLTFSQVEGGTMQPPAFLPISAAELEAELKPPLDAIARSEGVELEWDFGSLPRSFLGDPEALRIILGNLVSNAIYHAYHGARKGQVRVAGKALLPETLQLSVEDDGMGIPRKEAASVFEAFYRGEASRLRQEKGSGLGLFIAKRRAELIGGRLDLECPYARIDGSRPAGCRFVFEFPFQEPDHVQ
jgi:signal transduction histidine kinase